MTASPQATSGFDVWWDWAEVTRQSAHAVFDWQRAWSQPVLDLQAAWLRMAWPYWTWPDPAAFMLRGAEQLA